MRVCDVWRCGWFSGMENNGIPRTIGSWCRLLDINSKRWVMSWHEPRDKQVLYTKQCLIPHLFSHLGIGSCITHNIPINSNPSFAICSIMFYSSPECRSCSFWIIVAVAHTHSKSMNDSLTMATPFVTSDLGWWIVSACLIWLLYLFADDSCMSLTLSMWAVLYGSSFSGKLIHVSIFAFHKSVSLFSYSHCHGLHCDISLFGLPWPCESSKKATKHIWKKRSPILILVKSNVFISPPVWKMIPKNTEIQNAGYQCRQEHSANVALEYINRGVIVTLPVRYAYILK